MELTVNNALLKGIEAHKAGRIQEADQMYTAILKVQPNHPDANHNMGVLAVGLGKVEEALPFFKKAIDSNQSIVQFWLSYLDALIKLDKFADAYEEIKKLNEIGLESEKIDTLRVRLDSIKMKQSLVNVVKEFYQNITSRIISEAAWGWLFADSFDNFFILDNLSSDTPPMEKSLIKNSSLTSKNEQNELQHNSSQILIKLNEEKNISKRYNYLKNLIISKDLNLVNDSFKENHNVDLKYAVEETFDSQNLNIVIIGGGVCGLFLAYNIKTLFEERVNVLVLDTRSSHANTREPFKREWLTNISARNFKIGKTSSIFTLLESFGTNGLIGIPINILETILQLSCKEKGVKFHFSKMFDYSNLSNDIIDLIFDATGGRLKECSYSITNPSELAVKIPYKNMDFNYCGIKQLQNFLGVEADHLNVVLKPNGDFHYPHIQDSMISINMVKIRGIPINLMQNILEEVKKINSTNLFYVWKGALIEEINEGLILINLLDSESEILTSFIDVPISLKLLLTNRPDISDHINESIIYLFKMLVGMDMDNKIKIEKPFKYRPYINLNAAFGLLNAKSIFPIGDSIFCGHPKMGNGLGMHLPFIKELIQKMNDVIV